MPVLSKRSIGGVAVWRSHFQTFWIVGQDSWIRDTTIKLIHDEDRGLYVAYFHGNFYSLDHALGTGRAFPRYIESGSMVG